MIITDPTYLIAELTGDVVPLVRQMRERFNPDNVFWPADITIAGSSGLGTIKYGQSLNSLVDQLTPVVHDFGFKNITFVGVSRFPNTGIYYLAPEAAQFKNMHQSVRSSGVEFNESEWPYNPHCTLRWLDDDSPDCKELFDSIALPKNSAIECFSLYQPKARGGSRLHKF